MLQSSTYLIGDSMLSTPSGSPYPSVKPIFSNKDPHVMGYEIVGQRQKIVQLSDEAVFAWSGRADSAAEFFDAATEMIAGFSGTAYEFVDALNEIWWSIEDNSLTVFSAHASGRLHGLNTFGPTMVPYDDRKTVFAGKAWKELARVHSERFLKEDLSFIEEPLGLAALAQMHDQYSDAFLRNRAGGAFESAIVTGGRVSKLESYLIVPIRLFSDCAIVWPQWYHSKRLFERCTAFSLINFREFLIQDGEFIADREEKPKSIRIHTLTPPNISESEAKKIGEFDGSDIYPIDPKILVFNYFSPGHGGSLAITKNSQHNEAPLFDGERIQISHEFFRSIMENGDRIRNNLVTNRFFT
jgi:hypothetical protein